MKNNKERYLADLILFIASMFWGLGYFFQKAGSGTTAALTFNCLRYVIAALVILAAARFRLPPKGEPLKYSVLTGFILIIGGNMQQTGIQTASIGNASFITSIYIVFVPFIAGLVLRRKIKKAHYIAALLSLAGLYLITTSGKGLDRITAGDLIMLVGSVFWAIQILLVDKGVSLCDPVVFTAGEFTTAAVLQLLIWLTLGKHDVTGIPSSWPYAAASGVFVLGMAFIMQAYGQKHTGETEASIIMGLESVFGTLAGFLLWHEQFSPIRLAGMAVIFTAVMITLFKI